MNGSKQLNRNIPFARRTALVALTLVFTILGLNLGCESRLERQGVPIVWWVTIDERYVHADTAWLNADVPSKHVVFGLTLRLDSAGQLQLLPADLTAMRRVLTAAARRGYHTRLALAHEQPADTGAALHRNVLYAYAHALRRFEGLPLSDSAIWFILPSAPRLWPWPSALPDSLRPRALTSRWLSPQPGDSTTPCPPSGRLGVPLGRPLSASLKADARELHPPRSAPALRCGASVLLGPLYLGGVERQLQVQNALRFWPDSLKIDGLVIGTAEPVPAWVDSTSPFGLLKPDEHTQALRRWLDQYARPR